MRRTSWKRCSRTTRTCSGRSSADVDNPSLAFSGSDFETSPAARLVSLRGSDEHNWVIPMRRLSVNDAVGVRCRRSTVHADCAELDHIVGNGKELGHWSERFPSKILVEPRADHLPALVRKVDH